MLTAEVHGTEVRGLALCPGRVVRFVMDEQLQRLQVADLLRLTKARRDACRCTDCAHGQQQREAWRIIC